MYVNPSAAGEAWVSAATHLYMSRKVPCTHVFKVLREDRMNYSPSHLENVGRDIVQNGHDVLYQVELRLVPKHVLHAQGRRETHTIMSHTCTEGEERLIQSCHSYSVHAQRKGKVDTNKSYVLRGRKRGSQLH